MQSQKVGGLPLDSEALNSRINRRPPQWVPNFICHIDVHGGQPGQPLYLLIRNSSPIGSRVVGALGARLHSGSADPRFGVRASSFAILGNITAPWVRKREKNRRPQREAVKELVEASI